MEMTQASIKMPTIQFGAHTISRLIVGGNQQNGAAHNHSKALSRHMLEYFTVDRTVEFLQNCLAQGINTWQANYNEKTRDVLLKIREGGEDINIIPLSSPLMADRDNGWVKMMDLKPIGVYLYGLTADILWREGKIDTIRDFLARIRDTGVQVGVGTHVPEVIEYIEEKGWDVDFYMASLYKWAKTRDEILAIMPEIPHDGYEGWDLYLPSEYNRMLETVSKTVKTCLVFKLFAGGRTCSSPEKVSEIFQHVLGHIKPTDAVVVGMYPRFTDEITENANLTKKFS